MSVLRLIFYVSCIDCNSSLALFRRFIDLSVVAEFHLINGEGKLENGLTIMNENVELKRNSYSGVWRPLTFPDSSDKIRVMAAVRVVLPWSTCPIVPTLIWGFVLTKACFLAGAAYPRHWCDEEFRRHGVNVALMPENEEGIKSRPKYSVQRAIKDTILNQVKHKWLKKMTNGNTQITFWQLW